MIFYDENNNLIDHEKLEKEEQILTNKYINIDDVVLELGARYGTVSCSINKKINFTKNQVSIEPDERVWKALERNMEINNCNFHIVKGFCTRKKLTLTNLDCYKGGYGSKAKEDMNSKINCYTLEEIEKKFNLKFNVLVADCEGFLEKFLDENEKLYKLLRMIIFEADWKNECNYDKIKKKLLKNGFEKIVEGFQNVYIKKDTN